MKKEIFITLLIWGVAAKAQTLKDYILQNGNSATIENRLYISKIDLNNAYKAYSENKLEKTKYFIDQSQREGAKIRGFYFLLGTYMYDTEEYGAAKRYWNIAFKEQGCWQCKNLLMKLENKEPLKNLIDNIIELYLNETKQ